MHKFFEKREQRLKIRPLLIVSRERGLCFESFCGSSGLMEQCYLVLEGICDNIIENKSREMEYFDSKKGRGSRFMFEASE